MTSTSVAQSTSEYATSAALHRTLTGFTTPPAQGTEKSSSWYRSLFSA